MRALHPAWLLVPLAITAATAQASNPLAAQSLRPVAPAATVLQRPMLRLAQPVGSPASDLQGQNAVIDGALAHFAAANAGNPGVAAALEAAAADLSRNPGAYLNGDGSVNKNAMQGLVGKQFQDAGPVSLPSAGGGEAGFPNLGAAGDDDIAALATIVMMEAAKSSRDDLKAVMDAVKATNDKKAAQRDAMRARTQAMQDVKDAKGAEDAKKNAQAGAQVDKDSLSDMGEQDQLRLQMAMDRYSKAMATLSNLMQKNSDTSSAIIGNMK